MASATAAGEIGEARLESVEEWGGRKMRRVLARSLAPTGREKYGNSYRELRVPGPVFVLFIF